ncbi:DUF1272 domain-containing protein [Pararhodobacter aggregans]|uniref:DUF1272 domain-containing protein n=1 Tax=Pararhodobacter aggregans TaxID=404875 RepID=A0A2T7UYK8_9RHOB|nr:DUF1272 domain-containing protein [Pararhodobacter aggregans]PTX05263.1 hypothetical protein C8N33_101680 [Pararhodobacter aggregans]PVE49558.1 DUF1272 domain-containing protein [Pararhodobacter aggregans]
MLDLRPNCEFCDRDLPPDTAEARICSYECTYCAECAENLLHNVCPTCGGNFQPRPIRPRRNHREGKALGLGHHPAATRRHHSPWSAAQIAEMVHRLASVAPDQR